jgi:hypothetical protein
MGLNQHTECVPDEGEIRDWVEAGGSPILRRDCLILFC